MKWYVIMLKLEDDSWKEFVVEAKNEQSAIEKAKVLANFKEAESIAITYLGESK